MTVTFSKNPIVIAHAMNLNATNANKTLFTIVWKAVVPFAMMSFNFRGRLYKTLSLF